MAPLRFVILHHTTDGGEHWDLCLERDDVLLTWQLEREPTDQAALPILARPIGDHRPAYLDYEGPVSRNRGQVTHFDRGLLEFEQITANRYVFRLEGGHLTGRFTLIHHGDAWLLDAEG